MDVERIAARVWPGRRGRRRAARRRDHQSQLPGRVRRPRATCSASAARTRTLLGIDRRAEYGRRASRLRSASGRRWSPSSSRRATSSRGTSRARRSPPEEIRRPRRAPRDVRGLLRRVHDGPRSRPVRRVSRRRGVPRECRRARRASCRPRYETAKELARPDRAALRAAPRRALPQRPAERELHRTTASGSGSSTGSTRAWATSSSTWRTSRSTTSSHRTTRTACCWTPTSARCAPGDAAHLQLMRFMSDFREAMWGVVQQGDLRARLRLRGLRAPALRPARGTPPRAAVPGRARGRRRGSPHPPPPTHPGEISRVGGDGARGVSPPGRKRVDSSTGPGRAGFPRPCGIEALRPTRVSAVSPRRTRSAPRRGAGRCSTLRCLRRGGPRRRSR